MRRIIYRAYQKAALFLFNNRFTSWLLVLLKLDHLPKTHWHHNDWAQRKYQDNKTLQENVGYSHHPHIQRLMDIAHARFKEFAVTHLKPGSAVLDMACGTGLFLKDLEGQGFKLYGVDLNEAFLQKAKEIIPDGTFYQSSLLSDFAPGQTYDLISCFGALMYVEPSKIEYFFDKVHGLLNKGGYVFIQYSQALTTADLWYADVTYIKYTPEKIEKAVGNKFRMIEHMHFYDERKVTGKDSKHYYYPDGTDTRLDTVENTYLLILQKQ